MLSNLKSLQSSPLALSLESECWSLGGKKSLCKKLQIEGGLQRACDFSSRYSPWHWPVKPIVFIADPHADADAFITSLVNSGSVSPASSRNSILLSNFGQNAQFIIGGDCLDKGPSNLGLLRVIRNLIDTGASVKILAGNHDVRLLMGLRTMGRKKNPLSEHFFLRMGAKAVPLLKEVYETYFQNNTALEDVPDEKNCKAILLPGSNWGKEFTRLAKKKMPVDCIKKEVKRISEKTVEFVSACKDAGLSMQDVYRVGLKCQDLFLKRSGEFYWFFNTMELAYREGSFLFLHAGIDDCAANMVQSRGAEYLNRLYKQKTHFDLFDFYYGVVANMLRTKYRKDEMPLTAQGVDKLHREGIHALVHGHKNRYFGQRIALREGLLHFECDTTMDINSRKKEKLTGHGSGATLVLPEGKVVGLSSDYSYAKVFEAFGS